MWCCPAVSANGKGEEDSSEYPVASAQGMSFLLPHTRPPPGEEIIKSKKVFENSTEWMLVVGLRHASRRSE